MKKLTSHILKNQQTRCLTRSRRALLRSATTSTERSLSISPSASTQPSPFIHLAKNRGDQGLLKPRGERALSSAVVWLPAETQSPGERSPISSTTKSSTSPLSHPLSSRTQHEKGNLDETLKDLSSKISKMLNLVFKNQELKKRVHVMLKFFLAGLGMLELMHAMIELFKELHREASQVEEESQVLSRDEAVEAFQQLMAESPEGTGGDLDPKPMNLQDAMASLSKTFSQGGRSILDLFSPLHWLDEATEHRLSDVTLDLYGMAFAGLSSCYQGFSGLCLALSMRHRYASHLQALEASSKTPKRLHEIEVADERGD